MQRTARENVQHPEEPSIIIDPILFACATPCLLQRVCEAFIGFTRVVVIVSLAATTGFATAQVVRTRSLGQTSYGAVGDNALAAARKASRDSVQALGCMAEPVLATIYGRPERPTICAAATSNASDPAPTQRAASVASEGELTTMAGHPPVAQPHAAPTSVVTEAPHVPHIAPPLLPTASNAEFALPTELASKARQELARGKFDEALRLAQRAVDMAPQRATFHVTLGDVLRLRGDIGAASVQYEFAKRLQPAQVLQADRVLPKNPF